MNKHKNAGVQSQESVSKCFVVVSGAAVHPAFRFKLQSERRRGPAKPANVGRLGEDRAFAQGARFFITASNCQRDGFLIVAEREPWLFVTLGLSDAYFDVSIQLDHEVQQSLE